MTNEHQQPEQLAEQFLKVLDKFANARDAQKGALPGARSFSAEQLAIETDFRALLTGLRRAREKHPLEFMEDPVLSEGKLELGEKLPADVSRIDSDQGWCVDYAQATRSYDDLVIEHEAFKSDPLPRRLVAVNKDGRPVRIGYPRAKSGLP